jgi:hypothetical protein
VGERGYTAAFGTIQLINGKKRRRRKIGVQVQVQVQAAVPEAEEEEEEQRRGVWRRRFRRRR